MARGLNNAHRVWPSGGVEAHYEFYTAFQLLAYRLLWVVEHDQRDLAGIGHWPLGN
jgi:hypothetical protein